MATETRVKAKVVDADGHYLEPSFDLPRFMKPKYRDVAPHIVKRADGTEWWEGRTWQNDNPPGASRLCERKKTRPNASEG
ncbi:MAG: hypothetical protein IIC82_01260 [Chloroflexi bacterium]|nr:hypothetical protein [Chloroflexota bacterium]